MMATETTLTNAYEQVLDNMRQATESSLKMQRDALHQWAVMWPGFPSLAFPTPQSAWMEKLRDFHKQWSRTVSDLAHQHRSTLDRQYQAALESLDEALRASESSNPLELRTRSEHFLRKTLEGMREAFEVQLKEYQDAMNRIGELVAKLGT
jgi:hypothetical protein